MTDHTDRMKVEHKELAVKIEAAKRGYKVGRIGWNGSGMFLVIDTGGYALNNNHFDNELLVRPHWLLKTAQNDLAMWAPSGSDSLANNWVIVE